jgi:hypothetical protein
MQLLSFDKDFLKQKGAILTATRSPDNLDYGMKYSNYLPGHQMKLKVF